MKLNELGEFAFVDRINVEMISRRAGVIQGIGDDAAVVEIHPGSLVVLTTDMLVEGVHFFRHALSFRQLGHKSLAVNLSDVAAMGSQPLDALVSLAIPEDLNVASLEEMYEGIRGLARTYDVNLLGGDTTRSPGPLVVSIALTGRVPSDEVVLRSGGRPGDILYVTSYLGDAGGGLDLIHHQRSWDETGKEMLLRAHLEPKPCVSEGRFIAANHFATAMIDLSDGLASDLNHICERSGVGAAVHEGLLPVSETLQRYAADFGLDATALALTSGEDYGLLLACPSNRSQRLEKQYLEHFGTPIWRIGELTSAAGMVLVTGDGKRKPLAPTGWNHFRRGGG